MNLGDLLEIVRRELDDVADPPLWTDDELIEYAVDAQNEACRRGRLLLDSTTVSVTQIALTAAAGGVYALDPRVIRINRVKLAGDDRPIAPIMVRDLDLQLPGWEDWVEHPTLWVPDWESGKIRFVGAPDGNYTANLQVVRLPMKDLATLDDAFEIRAEHQRSLRHWIMHRAYLKRDSETYDPKKALECEARFVAEFGPARPAYDEQWMLQYYAGQFNGRY